MFFHYKQIVSTFSIVIASGPPASGKSTAIKAGLSLFGCSNNNLFVKGTNRGFLKRSSVSTLPFGIDDPSQGKKGMSRAKISESWLSTCTMEHPLQIIALAFLYHSVYQLWLPISAMMLKSGWFHYCNVIIILILQLSICACTRKVPPEAIYFTGVKYGHASLSFDITEAVDGKT